MKLYIIVQVLNPTEVLESSPVVSAYSVSKRTETDGPYKSAGRDRTAL